MRRRRSRSAEVIAALSKVTVALRGAVVWSMVAALSGAIVAFPRMAYAQNAPEREGAIFLLVPVGARAVGQGQAVAASRLGSDGIWWNPAALGWATRRELNAHYSSNLVLTGNAVDFVQPAGLAGVVGASIVYFNLGEQSATDEFNNTIGTIYPIAVALSASYAATFGDRVSAGVTYKYVNQSQSCGGTCAGFDTYNVSSSAFDIGVHAIAGKSRAITLGAAVRNAGFCIQISDAEQCDPPPTRVHVGVDYDVKQMAKVLPATTLHVGAEVVSRLSLHERETRLGAELAFAQAFIVRGGIHSGTADESYASIGFGIRRGTLGFDFARTFGGLSADAGKPPTYVAFRFAFR